MGIACGGGSSCASTACFGQTCDYWYEDHGATCSYEEYEWGCDCTGCACGGVAGCEDTAGSATDGDDADFARAALEFELGRVSSVSGALSPHTSEDARHHQLGPPWTTPVRDPF